MSARPRPIGTGFALMSKAVLAEKGLVVCLLLFGVAQTCKR